MCSISLRWVGEQEIACVTGFVCFLLWNLLFVWHYKCDVQSRIIQVKPSTISHTFNGYYFPRVDWAPTLWITLRKSRMHLMFTLVVWLSTLHFVMKDWRRLRLIKSLLCEIHTRLSAYWMKVYVYAVQVIELRDLYIPSVGMYTNFVYKLVLPTNKLSASCINLWTVMLLHYEVVCTQRVTN